MEYIKVLLPSLCVALLFWYVIRAIIRADSVERREMDRYYADLEETDNQGETRPGESSPAEPAAVQQHTTEADATDAGESPHR